MREWMANFADGLDRAKSLEDVFGLVLGAAQALGFEYCAYGLRLPVPVTRPRMLTINNYSATWWARYQKAGYLLRDPTVQHGRRSGLPVIWSDSLFVDSLDLWEDARSHGLRVGWARSGFDGHGVGGLLTFARSCEALTAVELAHKEVDMHWMVYAAHLALTRAVSPALTTPLHIALTPREIEVLKWAADGKTSFEIAQILMVGVDTVKFHTKNAIAKLGVANRNSAVVYAALQGLLG